MRIHMNAKVYCGEELYGKVSCVILDPGNSEMTHFVVSEKHLELPAIEHLVPVKHVLVADAEKIVLDCNPDELSKMDNFITQEFVPSGETIAGFGSEQLRQPTMLMTEVDHENIPADKLAIHNGADVFAGGNRIGKIDDFLVNSLKSDRITYLVMREGHLWNARKISIPVSEIEKIDDRGIHLKLTEEEVGALPSMKVHGWFN